MIVADSSVLIGLSTIGQLSLLRERFPDGILIPPAVWREVVEQGGERPGAQEAAQADWTSVEDITALEIVRLLRSELEAGEAEAIALAYQLGAEIILLGERDARRAAKQLNLQPLGTIGILIWAKRSSRIPSLRDALDALQTEGHFRIGQHLYLRALGEADEL